MAQSFRPLRVVVAVVAVAVASLSLTGCVTDPAPQMRFAQPGIGEAWVSWGSWPGLTNPSVAYVVSAWVGNVRQRSVRFDSILTDALITGLTNGTTYTFSVHGISALGNGTAESEKSNPVT